MKKIFILLVLLTLLFSIGAKSVNDISISFGDRMLKDNLNGLNLYYALNLGINESLELSLWANSSMTPKPFDENEFGLGLSCSLLGIRADGTYYSKNTINMLITLGLVISNDNNFNKTTFTDVYLEFTPLTLGTPIIQRRERFGSLGISYNYFFNKLSFIFSIYRFDFYVKKY